jgi:hypothetical protein
VPSRGGLVNVGTGVAGILRRWFSPRRSGCLHSCRGRRW